MSLIVDINPVPWKILDLVRARILKNRAKKAKKGMDWSKETLRREMTFQPAPPIIRRKDEPTFVVRSDMFFAISFTGYIRFTPAGGYAQIATRFTVKLNNQILGEVNLLPLSNQSQQFIFIWSSLESDLNEVERFSLYPEGLITIVTVVNTDQPSPTEISILELSNITSTDQEYSAALNYFSQFYLDDEFTRPINRFALVPKNQDPGTLTYTLQNWKY